MKQQDAGTQVVIVTGLSGAGRSQTAKILEDIDYFVVDNLPTAMISDLVATVGAAEGDRSRIAVLTDTRTGMDAPDLDLAPIDLINFRAIHFFKLAGQYSQLVLDPYQLFTLAA